MFLFCYIYFYVNRQLLMLSTMDILTFTIYWGPVEPKFRYQTHLTISSICAPPSICFNVFVYIRKLGKRPWLLQILEKFPSMSLIHWSFRFGRVMVLQRLFLFSQFSSSSCWHTKTITNTCASPVIIDIQLVSGCPMLQKLSWIW